MGAALPPKPRATTVSTWLHRKSRQRLWHFSFARSRSNFDYSSHNFAQVRVLGSEDRFDAEIEQQFAIRFRDYSADHEANVFGATFFEEVQRLARDHHMRSGQTRNREHVDVLLERGFDHLLRGLFESRENHLHPGLHAGVREQLHRVDMSVEAGLAERDANFVRRDGNLERADARAGFEN